MQLWLTRHALKCIQCFCFLCIKFSFLSIISIKSNILLLAGMPKKSSLQRVHKNGCGMDKIPNVLPCSIIYLFFFLSILSYVFLCIRSCILQPLDNNPLRLFLYPTSNMEKNYWNVMSFLCSQNVTPYTRERISKQNTVL